MTIIASIPSTHRSTSALCLSMTAALLTGCDGSSSTGQGPVVTATATSAVTASGAPTPSRTTFRIPVAPGAIFTYSHCVTVDQPAQQRSSTLEEFASLQTSENVILLNLDPEGQATKAQNDPAC